MDFSWNRGSIFDHLFAFILYERCIVNPVATVVSNYSSPTSKWYNAKNPLLLFVWDSHDRVSS